MQRSSCLRQVNPGSRHPSPNKHLSTKSQQPFVPALEKNLGGKVKSNIPQPRREPMAFKGVPAPKKSSGISPSFFPPSLERVQYWRGKLAICPAAPNSFHTVSLGNEVETTQQANPTVSTVLTRCTAPPPEDASPGRAPLRCQLQEGCVPSPGQPSTATLLPEHPPVSSLEWHGKYLVFG